MDGILISRPSSGTDGLAPSPHLGGRHCLSGFPCASEKFPVRVNRFAVVCQISAEPKLARFRRLKSGCLAQIIPLDEQQIRHAVKHHTEHYHVERKRQGLDNRQFEKRSGTVDMNSSIERRQRLGGVLNYYTRRAA